MRRLMTFVAGVLAGGALLWVALHYHVINTQQGLRLIPKVEIGLSQTYVDTRRFTVADWTNHPDLVRAVIDADQGELVGGMAEDALHNGLDRLFERLEDR